MSADGKEENDMYDWKRKREKSAFLALADGSVFRGYSFGAPGDRNGEVVFNTGMSGYQEIISDPSYAGQIVTMTSTEIGNYGCNALDAESRALFLSGLVVNEYNPPSNHRSTESLQEMLIAAGVPAIAGIDTRRLTTLLREKGTQKAWLHVSDSPIGEAEAVERARAWEGLDNQDYASRVSCDAPYVWNSEGEFRVVAYDYGIKLNILRGLAEAGIAVEVVPAQTPVDAVLARKPDGVFLSNGPADPSAVTYAIDAVRGLVGRVPLMGICLGHQLIGIALGARCGRLKFGHHGCNHPVQNLRTGQVEITSQNHNFALASDSLPDCVEVTHMNLNDRTVEGIRHRKEPVFSVQYHPESAPGPHDSRYLFNEFRRMMNEA